MRAGPLSNDRLIERLNRDFVNAWIIIPHFEKPEQFFEADAAIQFAKQIAKDFSYPVDSIVLSSDGETLAQASFEEIYRAGHRTDAYLKMLGQAVEQ